MRDRVKILASDDTGNGKIVVAGEHKTGLVPHQFETLLGIRTVTDDVAETIQLVWFEILCERHGCLQGFQVAVYVRNQDVAHGVLHVGWFTSGI